MDKIFKVQFFNRTTGEIFTLHTPYTDRTEACVCGQNYCRDRQQEDGTALFFRVVLDDNDHKSDQQAHPICGECDNDCQFCPTNYEEESEEPDFSEFEELVNLIFGN